MNWANFLKFSLLMIPVGIGWAVIMQVFSLSPNIAFSGAAVVGFVAGCVAQIKFPFFN